MSEILIKTIIEGMFGLIGIWLKHQLDKNNNTGCIGIVISFLFFFFLGYLVVKMTGLQKYFLNDDLDYPSEYVLSRNEFPSNFGCRNFVEYVDFSKTSRPHNKQFINPKITEPLHQNYYKQFPLLNDRKQIKETYEAIYLPDIYYNANSISTSDINEWGLSITVMKIDKINDDVISHLKPFSSIELIKSDERIKSDNSHFSWIVQKQTGLHEFELSDIYYYSMFFYNKNHIIQVYCTKNLYQNFESNISNAIQKYKQRLTKSMFCTYDNFPR